MAIVLGALFPQGASAENYPSYGVSNLIGHTDPALAARVSQGTDDIAKSIIARSTSGEMNAEVSRLLDAPRARLSKPKPAAVQTPVGWQREQEEKKALDELRVIRPLLAPASASEISAEKVSVSFPHELVATPLPLQETAPDPLAEALDKVHAALKEPLHAAPGEAVPPTPDRITPRPMGHAQIANANYPAQVPDQDRGPGVSAQWDTKAVKSLLAGTGYARSDLSVFRDGAVGGALPVPPSTRLMDTVLAPQRDGAKHVLWKPEKVKNIEGNTDREGLKKRASDSAIKETETLGAVETDASPWKLLRVAHTAPAAGGEGPLHSRSHTSTIHVLADAGVDGTE